MAEHLVCIELKTVVETVKTVVETCVATCESFVRGTTKCIFMHVYIDFSMKDAT